MDDIIRIDMFTGFIIYVFSVLKTSGFMRWNGYIL